MEYIKKSTNIKTETSVATEQTVKDVIKDIQLNGDEAIHKYEKKFGNNDRTSLRLSEEEIESAIASLTDEQKSLIDNVVERVSNFAKAQLDCLLPLDRDFGDGIRLGHKLIPVETVGTYVPGGRFPLLSSGVMVAAPAKVAGVKRIIACSPANYNGSIHPAIIYGLKQSGVTEIFAIGGAQAIAAMAYGSESVPQVDVISGPGNRFVAEAKRQVFGEVGIDLVAGPSEVVVFADEFSKPDLIAADLLAQAEHDPNARAILIITSKELGENTMLEVEKLLEQFDENSPAHESWNKMGEIIVVDSIQEGIEVCNEFAGEHLHLHLKETEEAVEQIHNYGSLFIGENSSVVFSDKVSGTNHTLPTNRGGRYTGGLWVGSYVKVATFQEITGPGVNTLATHASRQSEMEGLEGHHLSAFKRKAQAEFSK
ncbi:MULTISPECIES: histidinol dehydrogenase [Oceanobacillus]|uniref:histidinol dehydrogenase n=1 Tax=Oceanobacillus TaxID=182709 RepID=UPI00084E5FB8|nr:MULTISPECIES: histidinol dehydrogenase [Oceanobacillus]MBT2600504.1 histidinol dehydrogenase [Oceanobacillus sp. ISL-74]MBT2650662.1 histidinol dehydrogenase [Oceanobacillus sp. ISL-73]OEH54796.1 histidinol dehydrogenase [Oceanobacillus sp. E9]